MTSFQLESESFGLNGSPVLADIDGDQLLDLFLGNGKGGLYYYENMRLPVYAEGRESFRLFELRQNFPNPFNGISNFEFRISHGSHVLLSVFDVLGRCVATIVDETKPAGFYTVRWDAGETSSGMYLYRLIAGSYVETRKMLLVR